MTYEEYCGVRDRYGLTDYSVAHASHVSRSALSQWKNGNTKLSDANMERLERFVNRLENGKNESAEELFNKPTKKEPVHDTDLADIIPKIQSYRVKLQSGVEVELTFEEYNALKTGIDAYVEAWAKLNKKA